MQLWGFGDVFFWWKVLYHQNQETPAAATASVSLTRFGMCAVLVWTTSAAHMRSHQVCSDYTPLGPGSQSTFLRWKRGEPGRKHPFMKDTPIGQHVSLAAYIFSLRFQPTVLEQLNRS